MFFDLYDQHGLPEMNEPMRKSAFQAEQVAELTQFSQKEIRRPRQYEQPPGSAALTTTAALIKEAGKGPMLALSESLVYSIGMTSVRSDPYTGMAMLYAYLYCGGIDVRTRNLILRFPHITVGQWRSASPDGDTSKHTRLYRSVADAIWFADGFLGRGDV
jgi:hypothetical protein